jgi:hypothetical protein
MSRYVSLYFLLFTFIYLMSFTVAAQTPWSSPLAKVSQDIGHSNVQVEYYRPGVKGRLIFGGLVPYNVVWRAGANNCTKVIFDSAVRVGGKDLARGEYCLFVLPTDTSWTIMLNKNVEQWGAFEYNPSDDVIQFSVKPQRVEFTETFTIDFSEVKASSVSMNLYWERTKVSFKLEYGGQDTVIANIKKRIETKPGLWVYYQGAEYLHENNLEPELALEWINQSVALEESWLNLRLQAVILSASGNCAEAKKAAKKSIALGKEIGDQYPYEVEMQGIIEGCE